MHPMTGGDGGMVADMFCELMTSVEPYVMAAVPLVYEAEGRPLPPQQQRELLALPRNAKYTTLGAFAAKNIRPRAAQWAAQGVEAVGFESVTPFAVPRQTFLRIAGHWSGVVERRFAASQALLMMRPLGGLACGGYLTMAQGIHSIHSDRAQRRLDYLTPRYSGADISDEEILAVEGLLPDMRSRP